jgi:23S rRNA (guanosine2251-2'-O)-methyltransferase
MDNFIFGIRPVLEAIKSGKEIDKVLIKNNSTGSLIGELFTELKKCNIRTQYVPGEKIDKVSHGANHQGVVAYLSPVSYQDAEDVISRVIESGQLPLVIMLDGVTDVRNFGAIARTAECMGAHAIVIPEFNSVRITEDAIKTSAGALYNIPVCKTDNLVDTVMLFQQMGITVLAASEKSANLLYYFDLNIPLAIVLGAEDKGVSPQLLKRVDRSCKIPLVGKTDSLNVSVTAGIIISEVVRQRMKISPE